MSEINKKQEEKALILRDSLANDFDEKKAEDFASNHKNKTWYSDFILLYEMITHPKYKLSTKVKATIAGTLAYVVLPIDAIPDFLPVVGLLDDAFILAWTIKTLNEEIENFKLFKKNDK